MDGAMAEAPLGGKSGQAPQGTGRGGQRRRDSQTHNASSAGSGWPRTGRNTSSPVESQTPQLGQRVGSLPRKRTPWWASDPSPGIGTCPPRVAALTGARTALVTTRPCRAPHHTIPDVGLIGGGQVPLPGEVSLAQWRALFWMSCLSSGAISPKPSANPSERVSSTYNLERILNLNILGVFARTNRPATVSSSGRV